MLSYHPPWRDMRFVIEELLELPRQWSEMPAFSGVDATIARELIDQAGRFACDYLLPCNATGDEQGARLEGRDVYTPRGFPEAYRVFQQNGWPSLPFATADGGQGLPILLNTAIYEMFLATNHAWSMYTALLLPAYESLSHSASPELRARYLSKIVTGEWLVTMCLSEPQAGSDLGLISTRAVPQADGSHALSGTKIFISSGDHDLTHDILHLVLARLPDAVPGPKGLSLFVAAKWREDGSRNGIFVDGVEKKMGVKASATCVLRFDGATAWLVGEPHRGLAAMFPMMNSARLLSGVAGLGEAETAYQNAWRYASERHQLRAVHARGPGPSALIEHPAIRRLLLTLRARAEGSRFLCYQVAHLLDQSNHAADPQQRERAQRLALLLTPIVKAAITTAGFDNASEALQIFGGHGYLRDSGIEQTLRDARIGPIYEGTNQIQAIDLLARKGLADGAAGLNELFDWIDAGVPAQAAHGSALRQHIGQMRDFTRDIAEAAGGDAELPLRIADDYLAAMALLLIGQGFARADALAARAAGQGRGDADFYGAKRDTARFFVEFMLPEVNARLTQMRAARVWLPQLTSAT